MARVPKNKFAQIFKENAGMSFTEYVNGMRMEYAASLLTPSVFRNNLSNSGLVEK